MAGQKRAFPYYTPVESIDLKRRGVEGVDGVNPGEAAAPVRVFEQPQLGQSEVAGETDLSSWTDAQLKAFLDQRGEDRDDCSTRAQLVQRARECERATGPATKPVESTEDAEVDPLDAFMAEMQQLEQQQQQQPPPAKAKKAELEDEEDNVADFLEARARQATAAPLVVPDGGDSDEEVYATERAIAAAAPGSQQQQERPGSRSVGPLPPLDHEAMQYPPFAKDFYTPLPAVAERTPAQVNAARRALGVRVSGFDAPGPVDSFEQLRLPPALLAAVRKAGYEKPTAIQAQALPAALSGRDILGIAKTGSGKTAAFVLPMAVHIQDQAALEKGEGPIGVVVAPTRELAEQIHRETRRFCRPFAMRVAAGIGGLSKLEQFKDLKAGADAAVCTPGRLIDLVKMKACSLFRTTFLVFDEADRMFDMGFEPQVRSIIGQVRPDRQTMLFSATMPTKVERLVRDALTSPVRVTVGEVGAANEDIRQVVEVVPDAGKMAWLLGRLPQFVDQGEVLVFAGQIAKVDEIVQRLKAAGHRCVAIHGDMDQHSRAAALREFAAGRQHVLVATDVAARGLDIKSIKTVVNLDAARDIDTHVHRVGRTGRAGDRDGTAWTLLDPRESRFAGLLLNSMVAANQEISPALQSLALKDPRFRKGQSRHKAGGQFSAAGAKRRQQVGGAGIGFGPSRDDPMSELYGDREGYGKPAAAAGAAPHAGAAPQAKAAPSGFVAAASSLAVKGCEPLPPPPSAAQQPAVAVAAQQPAASQPAQAPQQGPAAAAAAEAEAPGTGGVFGGQGLRGIMQNRFRSQFVTSGTTGGDIGAKATIIAPKQPRQAAPAAEPAAMPSFLAKKAASQDEQAAQAIAAAKAIAARLGAGPGAAQPSQQPAQQPPQQQPQQASRGHPGGNAPRNLPAGLGASAGAYPDLSRDDGGSIRDSLAEERREARSSGFGGSHSSQRESPQQPHRSQPAPYQAVYSGQQQAAPAQVHSNGQAQPQPQAYAKYSAPQPAQQPYAQYAAPQAAQQPYAQYAPPQPVQQPYAQYAQPQPAQPAPPAPQPYGQYAVPQPAQPAQQPYPQYAAPQPAQPVQQPYAQYDSTAPAQPAQPPWAQQASAAPAQPQLQPYAQYGASHAPPAQPPQPAAGASASVQASIAAAQAIAARLTAQAGVGGQQQPPPRQPGHDSVAASIEAARAVAARFAARDGGASQLSNRPAANSGQWAWGKG